MHIIDLLSADSFSPRFLVCRKKPWFENHLCCLVALRQGIGPLTVASSAAMKSKPSPGCIAASCAAPLMTLEI
jgi:hypothetical protein